MNHHLKTCSICNRVIRCAKKMETANQSKHKMKNTNADAYEHWGFPFPDLFICGSAALW